MANLSSVSQALSVTFPGSTFPDTEFVGRVPRMGGVTLNQLAGVVVFVALLGASYLWARTAPRAPAGLG